MAANLKEIASIHRSQKLILTPTLNKKTEI